jgi:mRNA interferase RelE/StbE
MSSYGLLYKKPAAKSIQKLPPQIQKRLKVKLEWLVSQEDPMSLAEPLTKPADAQYRLRIGVYRILFDVKDKILIILLVRHRRDAYK